MMTGVAPLPAGRTSLELQAAAMPGYYLSSAVQSEPSATQLPQLLGVLEPAQLIGVPGLLAGARYAGESSTGAALEPVLGYRAFLDDAQRFALGAVGFLAYASEEHDGASFSALRGGLEANLDLRLTGLSKYAELHTNFGLNLTALSADGRYCLDSAREYGTGCPQPATAEPVSASASGVFPSTHVGLSADFGRGLQSAFHGVRLALDLAGGTMPTVVGAEQRGLRFIASGGLSLTVGLGASTAD